jgi:hypothetical protein
MTGTVGLATPCIVPGCVRHPGLRGCAIHDEAEMAHHEGGRALQAEKARQRAEHDVAAAVVPFGTDKPDEEETKTNEEEDAEGVRTRRRSSKRKRRQSS